MTFKFLKDFSFPKLISRFGTIIVDTFSTLIFFMLQGDSWVLTTTGLIFAVTKVWHWQQSFKSEDRLRRFLHRGAWFLMAVLSVYFLITLGLSITQDPPEIAVDEKIVALEQAIARSRVANVEAMTKEQNSLLQQNEGLTERLLTLNQWSEAWGHIQNQLNANLSRFGVIAGELNRIYAEQTATDEVKDIEQEKEETTILKFRPVKPIGAHSLMGRVMPDNWIDASIVLLFFLIGIVMEITLALSSLSEEKRLHGHTGKRETVDVKDWYPLPVDTPELEKEETAETVEEGHEAEEEPPIPPEPPVITQERKGYDSDEIMAYIDAAYEDNKLKPDNEIECLPESDCAGIREYLQSFKLRGKIIVEEVNGVYQVKLDKESLKKFIALQCNVQRV